MIEDFLTEKTRAEDIILGSLGFDEDAKLVSICKTENGFKGMAKWSDGEEFEIESDSPLSEIELWALDVLC